MGLLSAAWSRIQTSLFPFLEEELGPLDERKQKLIRILELIRIEESVSQATHGLGHPTSDRKALARAFVAKAVYNCPTTRDLIERVQGDSAFRRISGWERRGDIPSESTFSRSFSEFAKGELPARMHEALIEKYVSPRLVGHISRDGTEIEAREKPVSRKAVKEEPAVGKQRKRGRPRKGEKRPPKEPTRIERQKTMSLEEMLEDLPQTCDRGTKTNSKGYKESWNGYKLHIDVADGQIPISCFLTSASCHDSQVAIPLATMTATRVTNLYDLMDSAYDCQHIADHSIGLGHVPIIDPNRRNGAPRELAPAQKVRYHERTGAERVNGRLKDEFGGRMVRVRGATKVMAHLMFGILVLAADQIFRLIM
ncbi:MAG: transposase [Candidatus Latescibacteria bacterium]|nr:transposase [Candidatus Latescibacterota bacterium]